ncbi:MAG TPA: dTMP kinase [Geobacterales bacterium]|nr:dTMP kinase [Geobacterales bacterium]
MKGHFIVFEGIDGAGLTTNSKFLVDWLNSIGIRAWYTKEPTQGTIGLYIRKLLKSGADPFLLTLLFTADRKEHMENEVIPKIRDGIFVVCDRYLFSTIAYQSAHGAKEELIRRLNKNFLKPDLVFLLDIDPSISLNRKQAEKESYERKEFLEKVRRKFLELASDEGFIVIPTDRPLNEIQEDIKKVMKYFLEEVGYAQEKV